MASNSETSASLRRLILTKNPSELIGGGNRLVVQLVEGLVRQVGDAEHHARVQLQDLADKSGEMDARVKIDLRMASVSVNYRRKMFIQECKELGRETVEFSDVAEEKQRKLRLERRRCRIDKAFMKLKKKLQELQQIQKEVAVACKTEIDTADNILCDTRRRVGVFGVSAAGASVATGAILLRSNPSSNRSSLYSLIACTGVGLFALYAAWGAWDCVSRISRRMMEFKAYELKVNQSIVETQACEQTVTLEYSNLQDAVTHLCKVGDNNSELP